jgi:CheY-like chemotaxis protein
MRSVLVADTAEGCALLQPLLDPHFRTACVMTLSELRRRCEAAAPDVVVCGCHFDEGRMYDALRRLRLGPPRVPFVAIRALSGELDDAVYEGVKIATRALDGDAFVDLVRWQRKYGAEAAAARLVKLIQGLVDSPTGALDALR